MAIYVFDPELLTHTDVCYWLIASLGPIAVCDLHSTYCISHLLKLGMFKPRVIFADSIFFYKPSNQRNGKFLISQAQFLRKSACKRACVLTHVSAVFDHTDFVF